MALRTAHVLIHSAEDPSCKQPAILINNDLILAQGNILNFHTLGLNHLLLKSLEKFEPYFINKSINSNLNFSLIYELNGKLYTKKIFLHSVYNIKNLAKDLRKTSLRTFRIGNKNDNEIFLTTFLLFSYGETFDYAHLMKNLYKNYFKFTFANVNCLDKIVTYSTPFAFEVFHNFMSAGYVSNVFQNSNSNFFTVDLSGPYNQVGQGIYNKCNELIGIIIINHLEYLNDTFEAVFVANFFNIIENVLIQLNLIARSSSSTPMVVALNKTDENSFFRQIKNYSILIKNNNFCGTGSFARIHDTRFIISCSHILSAAPASNNIVCYYKNISFKIDNILFYNSRGNDLKIFDVSLLEIPASVSIGDENFAEIKMQRREDLTQKLIYSIGFPQFAIANEHWNPSVYKGRVIKSKAGIIYTNILVQAGQSGGPLIDADGNFVGISILNVKHVDTIYPKLNMAVPICDIYPCLEKYSKTNDVKMLEELINCDREIAREWNLENPMVMHKL